MRLLARLATARLFWVSLGEVTEWSLSLCDAFTVAVELGEVGGDAKVAERLAKFFGFGGLLLGFIMLDRVASLTVDTISAPVLACPAPWPWYCCR
jgi:DNA-binding transcriptional regulator LsrR (DeoR family)